MQNVNDMWILFKTRCLDLIDRHIPTKSAKHQMVYHGSTRTSNGQSDTETEHGPRWKKSRSQDTHSHYLSIRGHVQCMFRRAYWTYINDLINPPSQDSKVQGQKKFWSCIKSLKKDYAGIGSLKHDGKLITDTIGKVRNPE